MSHSGWAMAGQCSGQWGATKQPRNPGGLVFSTPGEAARTPHEKSSGSLGSAFGSGGAKGGASGGTAERRERCDAGGEACSRESGGRSRRRVLAKPGDLLQGTRWREAASRAVELAEGQMAGTSGQRAIGTQRRKIATWALQRSRSSRSRMPEWGTSGPVEATGR